MTVTHLIRQFKCSRDRVEDDPRSEKLLTAKAKDNVGLALQMIMQDCSILCSQIAERLGISTEQADNTLTKKLGFSGFFKVGLLFFDT